MNWNKRAVHTCYGCEYYHDENGFNNKEYNSKYCGQDHYKCPYFLGTGEPLGNINLNKGVIK